ncbi:hypothetical protein FIBSPDRAFT_943466 [Athelia psychrophila]|uniref:F-box domain-containing protein n=1 Tax=Athelia psychrophila TaxID=1759441 RepID=A0A166WEV5_9AGAM|nr:hypothetical protein FIBSPDRAFT_943466 [Fibularhizoctonia sp. CBS 109695]
MLLTSLPNELLIDIFARLCARDITRLSLTSKQCHLLAMDRVLWNRIYTNSSLLRPPGPFPHQSSRDLAVALLQSEELDVTWSLATSDSEYQSPPPAHRRVLAQHANTMAHLSLILGRWLLVGGEVDVQVYDLDAGALWYLPVGYISGPTNQIKATVYTSDDGVQSAFVVVYSVSDNFAQIYRTVLPQPGMSQQLSFQHVFKKHSEDWDTHKLDVGGDFLVLTSSIAGVTLRNIHTHQEYVVPEPQFTNDPNRRRLAKHSYQTVVTSTHIIIVYARFLRPTWFEVIPFPDASIPGSLVNPMLPVSHSGPGPEWLANTAMLSSTPSSVTILTTRLLPLDAAVLIVELQLKEDGLLNAVTLHRYGMADASSPYHMHILSGEGSEISARGVWFTPQLASRGMLCHALRVTPDLEAESGLRIEVGRHALTEHSSTYSPYAFDGRRGRLAYTEDSEVVILDYV